MAKNDIVTISVLSFDLGATSAYFCNTINAGEEFKIKGLVGLEKKVKELILKFKPEVILYPTPTRFYNCMRLHFQYIGIINMLAEKYDIQTVEVIDSRAKKVVLGNGKAKKEEIMKFYNEASEHCADARMFNDWYISSIFYD